MTKYRSILLKEYLNFDIVLINTIYMELHLHIVLQIILWYTVYNDTQK